MKRICIICGKNKVGLLAYWYGLRHCEECEIKSIRDEIKEIKRERKNQRVNLTNSERKYTQIGLFLSHFICNTKITKTKPLYSSIYNVYTYVIQEVTK